MVRRLKILLRGSEAERLLRADEGLSQGPTCPFAHPRVDRFLRPNLQLETVSLS